MEEHAEGEGPGGGHTCEVFLWALTGETTEIGPAKIVPHQFQVVFTPRKRGSSSTRFGRSLGGCRSCGAN